MKVATSATGAALRGVVQRASVRRMNQERDILESAVHAIAEQAKNASAIVEVERPASPDTVKRA